MIFGVIVSAFIKYFFFIMLKFNDLQNLGAIEIWPCFFGNKYIS